MTHFSSLEAANVSTLHHAVVVLFNQLILALHSLVPLRVLDIPTKAAAYEQISASITEILKSIDYHLQFIAPSTDTRRSADSNLASASGPHNFCLLLPLRVVCRALARSDTSEDIAKKMWLEDVVDIIKIRYGTWMSNDEIFSARQKERSQESKAQDKSFRRSQYRVHDLQPGSPFDKSSGT